MMNDCIRQLIESLHSHEMMASLAIAGAGSRAIGWILGVAGASRTVLDIQVPYASSSMIEYIGAEPEQFVSSDTARVLAKAAYRRAVRLRDGDSQIVGLACSATIATDRTKRGEHRCHVSAYDATGWTTSTLTLTKGLRTRDEEDEVVSRLILNALAESAGLAERVDPSLTGDETVIRDERRFGDPLEALAARHVQRVIVRADGAQQADADFRGAIMSGSFNPLHDGHVRMANLASAHLDKPAIYELSISNVDKPDLPLAEIRRRISQFEGWSDVAVTLDPVFYQKARLFPRSTFVIGFDTMTRLVDPRYYDGSRRLMWEALSELRALKCDFLVAGRLDDGVFKTLDDLWVPPEYAELFTQIPESAFRADISSTELRQTRRSPHSPN